MPSTDREDNSSLQVLSDEEEDPDGASSSLDLKLATNKIDDLLRPPNEQKLKHGFKPLDSGRRAQLRRTEPENPFTPALWHVLFEIDHDKAPGWWKHRENATENEWERRWAALLRAMTVCQGQHQPNVYSGPDTRLGTVLANTSWAEMRFVRLMEARKRKLETQVRHMAQYLASTGESLDWADAGRLLFFQSDDAAQNIRVGISRAYYGRQQVLEQETDQD
jgi:CRISPR type I-E-associated protein CasB/Cse2